MSKDGNISGQGTRQTMHIITWKSAERERARGRPARRRRDELDMTTGRVQSGII